MSQWPEMLNYEVSGTSLISNSVPENFPIPYPNRTQNYGSNSVPEPIPYSKFFPFVRVRNWLGYGIGNEYEIGYGYGIGFGYGIGSTLKYSKFHATFSDAPGVNQFVNIDF